MKTYYALLAFFVLEYVRPTSYFPVLIPLHLSTLALYGAAASCLLSSGWSVSNEEVRKQTGTKLLLFLLGQIAVTMATSESTMLAYEVARGVFEYILLYFVIVKQLTTLGRVKGLIWTLVLSNIAVALLTPELLTSIERPYLASGSFLGDGNDYALSVNIVLPLCLFLILEAKFRTKLVAAAGLLFLVFIIIMTQSRGGTLALMAVGVYYWVKSDRKIVTTLVASAAIGVVLLMAPDAYWTRMQDIVNTEEGSSAGRIAAWRGGWEMALDHPLFGVGAGRFALSYGANYRKSETIPWQTAHSVYFLALGELGFPGLGLVLTIIIWNLVANRRAASLARGRDGPESAINRQLLASGSAALIAFSVGGAFLSALYFPHIYVLSGILAASRRLALESQASKSATTVKAPAITVHWALRRKIKVAS